MKVTYIASFPPRECGIATFTQNLIRAVGVNLHEEASDDKVTVVAMNDTGNAYRYPPEVGFVVSQDRREDYLLAADYINGIGADICVLQHEFGIFGGESGVYILSLLHRLEIPFVVTFHTILKEPTYLQKVILQEIARRAAGVVVMSRKAVGFLDNIYEIPAEKIHLIEHGVPDIPLSGLPRCEDLLEPFHDRRILFTFGFLNRNKGIETVIKALPGIVAYHPEVVYLVLGNTHPGVVRHSGEEYRDYLKQLIAELGMESHVHFINCFVTEAQLAWYLSNIDIYITPYLNKAQITSGTLSYAVGAGAATLSTPYWHAQELLADGRGQLFDFKNSEQLAEKVTRLLDNPKELDIMQQKALEYGKRVRWPRTGKRYLQLFVRVLEAHLLSQTKDQLRVSANGRAVPVSLSDMPTFSLNHILRLTDDTGIIQHANYGIPNLKEGYCLDDNARSMVLALMAFRHHKSHDALRLLPIYMSFVHYMQREDGLFINFLNFRREYMEVVGSEDAFGRTIWALGYLIRYAPNSAYREFGLEMYRRAIPHFASLRYLRGIADTIIGITHYLACFPTDEGMLETLADLSGKLMEAYRQNASRNWQWYEKKMVYDNGILPLALLHSCEITGNAAARKIALESLQFLEKVCFRKDWFTPVGNRGWYDDKTGSVPLFDQQALETMAMVLLYHQAYLLTGKHTWLQKMYQCYTWFLGENELHIPLFDGETFGCCDGLQERGVNRNQGAESTLAYWISHLTVIKAIENEARHTRQYPPLRPEVVI
jgi:glycosyltransferase involved in cell wall biosynthesis